MAGREPIDVLLVSPGISGGWRRGDEELARAIEQSGASVATCTTDFRLARHLRRGELLTDLAESLALRHAVSRALRRLRPRAIVYSSPQAAMLQPRARLEGGTAVRFDAPAVLNRRGRGARLLHWLERRALARVRLLVPFGLELSKDARTALELDVPAVGLPIPIEPGPAVASREQLAVAHAADPAKKGLDLAALAWARAAPPGWRLAVTGIEPDRGRAFLRSRGVREPVGLEWAGILEPSRYRDLLARATVFVAASRYEDYGVAQLEALVSGALLVTVPSHGPYEALSIARELGPRLVAEEIGGNALAAALAAALALPENERESYRERARARLADHSRETLERRVADDVLPLLLG